QTRDRRVYRLAGGRASAGRRVRERDRTWQLSNGDRQDYGQAVGWQVRGNGERRGQVSAARRCGGGVCGRPVGTQAETALLGDPERGSGPQDDQEADRPARGAERGSCVYV